MLKPELIPSYIDILSKLHRQNDEQNIYNFVIQESIKTLRSTTGTLYITDVKSASLVPVSSVGMSIEKLKPLPFKFGLGICGWVAQNCESLIINEPDQDKRFTNLYDKLTGFKTENILCAPLMAHGECLGVIELFNRMDRKFLPEDLVFLDFLGDHMAVALENTILYKKFSQLSGFTYSILNCLPGGFIAFDNNGIVNFCNKKAEQILNLEYSIINQSIENAFKKIPPLLAILQIALKEKMAQTRQEVVIPGQPHNIRIGYSTLLIQSDSGQIIGRGIIFQDITPYQK